jgi:hypothetical protein
MGYVLLRRWTTPIAALALLLLAPGAARAATVGFEDDDGAALVFTAEPGEANDLLMESDGGSLMFRDDAAPLSAGESCEPVDAQAVRCDPGVFVEIEVRAGDGDDRIVNRVRGLAPVLHVQIDGGEGDDVLRGSRVEEGFDGGPGADYVSGGRGRDTLTASQEAADGTGVTVTLDGEANDGLPGEGDNVRNDIEYVTGGPGADTLVGNDFRNHLDGAGGADRVYGGRGPDQLTGGAGADLLDGGAGGDRLDALEPDGAAAPDRLFCDDGWDEAVGDAQDGIPADCEQYSVDGRSHRNRPTAASGTPPGLPAIVAPTVRVRGRTAILVAGCSESAGCSGTIQLNAPLPGRRGGAAGEPATLARGAFTARAGQVVVVRLKLSARARKLLGSIRRGTAVVQARGEHGGVRVTRRRVRLR